MLRRPVAQQDWYMSSAQETQNCCPCLHQRGAFYTTVITSHLSVKPLVLRQKTTKSKTKGHIRKSTIGRPDFANSADLELHATQRPKTAVGGQQKTSQTVVAQLSETQGCFIE